MRKFLAILFLFICLIPTQPALADITSNLIGHWKLDEGSGAVVHDSSSNNNTGFLDVNPAYQIRDYYAQQAGAYRYDPAWLAGKIGNAMLFDSTGAGIMTTKSLAYPAQFTVSFWFKSPTVASSQSYSVPFAWNHWDSGINFHWSHSDNSFRMAWGAFNSSKNWQPIQYATSLQANTWYLLTLTYDGTTYKAYLDNNGTPEVQVAFSPPYSDGGDPYVIIGNYAYTAYDNEATGEGIVDEVRIYERALSSSDIAELYAYAGSSQVPTRYGATPSGTISLASSVTLTLNTDYPATCKYSNSASTAYNSMPSTFSTTGAISHSTVVTGLSGGNTYHYYVRCRDTAEYTNTDDYDITFTVSATAHGSTLKVSSDGHYLTTLDGTPFLYLADTQWILNNRSDAHISAIVSDRAARGFTVLQVMPIRNWMINDYNDNPPFDDNDATHLNTAFWARMLTIADTINSSGMYLAMDIGMPGRKQAEGSTLPYCTTDAVCYEYGRQIGLKFKTKTNIIFNVGQDMNATGYISSTPNGVTEAGWRAIAEGVADGTNGANSFDGFADYSTVLETFHPAGDNDSYTWLHYDSWLDTNGIEWFGNTYNSEVYDWTYRDRTALPVKPILVIEGSYEGEPLHNNPTDYESRLQAYHVLFAGGAGYAYGHACEAFRLYVPNYNPTKDCTGGPFLDTAGSDSMQVLATFMASKDWWKFVPTQTMITSGAGEGVTLRAAVLSLNGSEAYVYFPTNSATSINLNGLVAGGSVVATWLKPTDGTTQAIDTYSNTQTVSFTPPVGWTDALLQLNVASVTKVMTPVITPDGSSFDPTQSVMLTCDTSGATIRYTTNGDEPTAGSTAYSSALTLTTTTTLKAKAFKDGLTDSNTASAVFSRLDATSIVGWWKLDEGTGLTALDSAAVPHNGTIAGSGASYVSGQMNYALNFDNAYSPSVNMGDALDFTSASITIALWLKPTGMNGYMTLVSKGDLFSGSCNFCFGGLAWEAPQQLRFKIGTTTVYSDNGSFTFNEWQHIAVTYDGAYVRFYRNGVPKGTRALTAIPSGNASDLKLTSGGFDGAMDDVRIYSAVLPASSIRVLSGFTDDAQAPFVSVSAPAPGTVSGTAEITTSVSDNVGVVGVQFKLDGDAIGVEDTISPFAHSWDSTAASNGSHALTATARDAAGNTTTSSGVSVTVSNTDTTIPTITIVSPSASTTYTTASTINSNGTASDDVEVTEITCVVNTGSCPAPSETTIWTITNIPLTAGSNTLTVTAHDGSSNTADAVKTIVRDNTNPSVTISSPAADPYTSEIATVTVSGTFDDNIGVTSVSWSNSAGGSGSATVDLDAKTFTCSVPLYVGSQTITITSFDASGNSGTDTNAVTYTPPTPTNDTVSSPMRIRIKP